jgi:hypothetical protein
VIFKNADVILFEIACPFMQIPGHSLNKAKTAYFKIPIKSSLLDYRVTASASRPYSLRLTGSDTTVHEVLSQG